MRIRRDDILHAGGSFEWNCDYINDNDKARGNCLLYIVKYF